MANKQNLTTAAVDIPQLATGNIVTDGVGDRGVILKFAHPRVKSVDPKTRTPIFEKQAPSALVEWETLNGKPVFKQGSWEDVADLTFVSAS